MRTFECTLTDTFGGDANYSWVTSELVTLPDGASDRSVVIAGKKALGITGQRCVTQNYGDSWRLDVVGECVVAFISEVF